MKPGLDKIVGILEMWKSQHKNASLLESLDGVESFLHTKAMPPTAILMRYIGLAELVVEAARNLRITYSG